MAIAEVIHSGLFDNLPKMVRKREGAVEQEAHSIQTRDLIDAAKFLFSRRWRWIATR